MLVIREEQMRIFRQAQQRRFEEEMVGRLARNFAGRPCAADTAGLRVLVQEGIQAARKYGIVTRFDVCRFLECCAEYGPGFDKLPWAARILNDPTLSGSGKMERIDDYSLFSLRP